LVTFDLKRLFLECSLITLMRIICHDFGGKAGRAPLCLAAQNKIFVRLPQRFNAASLRI